MYSGIMPYIPIAVSSKITICGGNTVKLQYTAINSRVKNIHGTNRHSVFLSPYSSHVPNANAHRHAVTAQINLGRFAFSIPRA